jgi:hypothetical protein
VPRGALDVRGDIYRNGVLAFPIPTAHFYKQDASTTATNHFQNIKSGWLAFTHAPVTIPGVIEAYTVSGFAGTTTDNTGSGIVVKLCKEGLYRIDCGFSLQSQSGINTHIGIYIRPVPTSYIPSNTGTTYENGITSGSPDGYSITLADYNIHAYHSRMEFIRVTKAPGYAYVTMTPNSNDATHWKFTHYGSSTYARMDVMYLG